MSHFLAGKHFLMFVYDEDECPIYQHGQILECDGLVALVRLGSWEDDMPVEKTGGLYDKRLFLVLQLTGEQCFVYDSLEEVRAAYQDLNSDSFAEQWEAKMEAKGE